MFPTLKRMTKKKIFHSFISTFDMEKVSFIMQEIGKSLSFSKASLAVLTKYIFLVCFTRYFL